MSAAQCVRWMPAWREWRAECTCGWIGSYLKTEAAGEAEAERHRKIQHAVSPAATSDLPCM